MIQSSWRCGELQHYCRGGSHGAGLSCSYRLYASAAAATPERGLAALRPTALHVDRPASWGALGFRSCAAAEAPVHAGLSSPTAPCDPKAEWAAMAGMKRLAKEIKALQANPDGVSLHSAATQRRSNTGVTGDAPR